MSHHAVCAEKIAATTPIAPPVADPEIIVGSGIRLYQIISSVVIYRCELCLFIREKASDVVLETKVLVSRRLEDKK